jgi:hypothetical protein
MEDILQERERIKQLHIDMLEDLIEDRQSMAKSISRHTVSISGIRNLQERFFWYIDNPKYERSKEISTHI